MRDEFKKYLLRYVFSLMLSLFFVFQLKPKQIGVVTYHILLVVIGVLLADLTWALFYKKWFGKMEVISKEYLLAIAIFRGMWCGSVILATALGL